MTNPSSPHDDARRWPAILEATRAAADAFLRTREARAAAAPVPAIALPALPDEGWGALAALAFVHETIEPWLSGSTGPRYLGFVTGGSTPAAVAGDWLVAAYDQNVSHDDGSIASTLERHTLGLLRALFGVPDSFEGAFVTGATQANVVALATAREWIYSRRGHDVAANGLAGAPPVHVLGGTPHASIEKALSILGMGRRSLERVALLPGREAVDPEALDARLRALAGAPCVVVASAGEVNTGDFDDLRAVADVARRHGAWLHVDGAFGLFAACDPSRAAAVDGIAEADSITADAHKWLNVPYDAGFVFTRHLAHQEAVFKSTAAYLGAGPDLLHRTPESSRRFRALPAWMTLMAYGRHGHREMIARACAQATSLGARIAASSRFELLAPVRLNIVCFALRAGGEGARDQLLAALRRDGRTYLTPTTFHGRAALRAAFSNWSTTDDDVRIVGEALEEMATHLA